MGFLSNFKFGAAPAKQELSEPPVRSRTFSASAYRDAELAREAEARRIHEAVHLESSTILTPAIAPVAEVLMAQDEAAAVQAAQQDFASLSNEAGDFASDEGLSQDYAPLSAPMNNVVDDQPALEPMHWEEAVGWLSQRSAESRNFVAQYWNWDEDLRILEFLVRQPDIDAGVAAGVFWLTAASEDHFPWNDEPAINEIDQQVAKLSDVIGRRFSDGDFMPMAHGFDDSWDCERLKERLSELAADGRIEWSPDDLPTSSHAAMLTFDDIPADERDEVIEFLARFGVR